ncbi:unnamed protein product [Effrenium voratum]|nr:unnamed protein product [Effrenium voratum]
MAELKALVDEINAALKSGSKEVNDFAVQDARTLFEAIDVDEAGALRSKEIIDDLKQLDLSAAELVPKLVSSIEPNADGLIEMAAFVAALDPKKYSASAAAASSASPSLAKHPRKEEMRAVVVAINSKLKQGVKLSGVKVSNAKSFFNAMDVDKTKSLTSAEISKGLQRLGCPVRLARGSARGLVLC